MPSPEAPGPAFTAAVAPSGFAGLGGMPRMPPRAKKWRVKGVRVAGRGYVSMDPASPRAGRLPRTHSKGRRCRPARTMRKPAVRDPAGSAAVRNPNPRGSPTKQTNSRRQTIPPRRQITRTRCCRCFRQRWPGSEMHRPRARPARRWILFWRSCGLHLQTAGAQRKQQRAMAARPLAQSCRIAALTIWRQLRRCLRCGPRVRRRETGRDRRRARRRYCRSRPRCADP